MTTKRVYSEFRNPHLGGLSSTEEFIQRCKTMYSGNNLQQNKHDGLEQSTILTFIRLLSDIAARCQSLELNIKEVKTQVSDLQKTMQDLCITGDSKIASNEPVVKSSTTEPEEESSPEVSENGDTDSAGAATVTNAKSKPRTETEDVNERLQSLQWKTFDLQRQNELLRRMLEIQCTVNDNAAKTAAEKKEKENKDSQSKEGSQTIQQADSTSNNNSASREQAPMSPNSNHPDYVPSIASSTTDPIQSSDQQLPLKDNDLGDQEHEEYVPLSAQEMLAQSFVDPKVPWSAEAFAGKNEGTDENFKYAFVYGPCVMSEMRQASTLPRKGVLSLPPMTPTKGISHLACERQTLGDAYHWEKRAQESQNNLTAN